MESPILTMPRVQPDDEAIQLDAAGRGWVLRRSGNLEALWNGMDSAAFDEDKIPYWTELWPASLALAQWLGMRAEDIRGRPCLDIGCGLGFTALVGQWLGANMAAFDLDAAALAWCRKNAALNGVSQPAWLRMDWRRPAFVREAFQRIWAADTLYEKRFIKPLADFLDWSLERAGRAWLAEPGRKGAESFLDEAANRGWRLEEVHAAFVRNPDASAPMRARIWEIRKLDACGEDAAWAS